MARSSFFLDYAEPEKPNTSTIQCDETRTLKIVSLLPVCQARQGRAASVGLRQANAPLGFWRLGATQSTMPRRMMPLLAKACESALVACYHDAVRNGPFPEIAIVAAKLIGALCAAVDTSEPV